MLLTDLDTTFDGRDQISRLLLIDKNIFVWKQRTIGQVHQLSQGLMQSTDRRCQQRTRKSEDSLICTQSNARTI